VLKLTRPLLFVLQKIVIVMKPLSVFSIIIVVLVIAGSSNIFSSFRLNDNHVDSSIGSSSFIENIFFLSGDGKSSFSPSLLQPTSAQEQEEQVAEQQEEGKGEEEKEEEQEENGKDSDMAMEKSEGQDEAQSESEPYAEQDEQKSSQEEQLQRERAEGGGEEPQEREQIKADCEPGEHFDSGIDVCIPDQEKVCDDQIDNDRDGKVDSKDPDCLPTKNEQEQQEHDSLNEQDDNEKLTQEEGRIANLNNEQENNTKKSPMTLEQQDNNIFQNDSASSGSYGTVNGAQNNQNLTNSNSSVAVRDINNNNNTLFNKSLSSSNASAAEDNLTLTCPPRGITMVPGAQATLTCTLESKGDKPENLIIDCSGLQNSRIECYIDGQYLTKRTLINPMSHIDFSIVLVSQSVPPTAAGTYSFDISVAKCNNSDQC
jgi:hypothetical protein